MPEKADPRPATKASNLDNAPRSASRIEAAIGLKSYDQPNFQPTGALMVAYIFKMPLCLTPCRRCGCDRELGSNDELQTNFPTVTPVHRRLSVGLAEGYRCPMPVTQVDLADALGLTSVHVNRVLKDMRAQNLVTLRGKTLVIDAWDELLRAAEFDPTYLHLEKRAAA
jgi:hypothetical protein